MMDWLRGMFRLPSFEPDPEPKKPMTARQVAEFILDKEGRFDGGGRLQVYRIPPGDGGGTFEVAGINDRYHPKMANELAALIRAGQHEAAKQEAITYLIRYTKTVASWHPDPRVTGYLRDVCFNRGAGGAAAIFQHSLRVAKTYAGKIDRQVGAATKAAASKHAAEDLILRLTLSRQWYERVHAKRSERSVFWGGLTNRWVDAAQLALGSGDAFKNLR